MMICSKLSFTFLVVILLHGVSVAQSPKIRSFSFGGEVSYGYRTANELNLGVNLVTIPNLSKKMGCIYSLSYNGLYYFRNHSDNFGQRIALDVGFWKSDMKIGILPHAGLFIESREAFNLYGGVSCGVSILNFVCLNYKYTFTGTQTTLPINNHSISVILKLNFTTIDLGWYKLRAASGKR